MAFCSVTLDIWESIQKLGYLGATMHWITGDFRLRSHTIALNNITGRHTGESLCDDHMIPLFDKWKIKSKIVGITTDNGN